MTPTIPASRVLPQNRADIREGGSFVLYWMIAARRTGWNFGLQHAVAEARRLKKPLLVLEALRTDYRWASDRFHTFVIEGMADQAAAFEAADVCYFPYVEREKGAGKGLLEALAKKAALVVTDHFPCFFLPNMVKAAAKRIDVRLEAVDSNGIFPLEEAPKAFTTAFSFRRFLQKNLREHLDAFPQEKPLRKMKGIARCEVPASIKKRWKPIDPSVLGDAGELIASLPIDHEVGPVDDRGGSKAGARVVSTFLKKKLARYKEDRNQPEQDVASGLSPYLHFGHVSAHQVVRGLFKREDWTLDNLSDVVEGKREGWWGASPEAEAFLDQVVTWREVGYVFCHKRPDYDRFESLPGWARETLDEHASDPREYTYDLEDFENARTHDPLWNAAQRQLRREGRIHNYLRMLWGKKVLEWTSSPRQALDILIELNNKYALDGRNPNSYSGIFWTLGRFDRAWGPVRRVFGKIRFMSSANTARKVRVKEYIEEYSEPDLFSHQS